MPRLSLKFLLIPGLAGVFGTVQILVHRFGLPIDTIAKFIPFRCPLKLLFGISCPTCGLGRAVLSLLAGRWQDSWDYHPLGIPALLVISGLCLFYGSRELIKWPPRFLWKSN